MKKFLSLLVLMSVFALTDAQTSLPNFYLHDSRVGTLQEPAVTFGAKSIARDSVNSGTTVLAPTTSYAYCQSDSINLHGSYRVGAIEVLITKASGTLAGSIYLQGSLDGQNWNNIEDTATIANGTSYAFTWVTPRKVGAKESGQIYVNPPILPYYYYRVYIAGTGTWCGTFWSYFVGRQ